MFGAVGFPTIKRFLQVGAALNCCCDIIKQLTSIKPSKRRSVSQSASEFVTRVDNDRILVDKNVCMIYG